MSGTAMSGTAMSCCVFVASCVPATKKNQQAVFVRAHRGDEGARDNQRHVSRESGSSDSSDRSDALVRRLWGRDVDWFNELR